MHFARAAIEGNPFLGIFARTNDSITLLPKNSSEKLKRICSEVLKTQVFTTSVSNSNLIGIFSAMNSNGMVLPAAVHDYELKELKQAGINVEVICDKNSAFGNNILANDSACLVNPAMSHKSVKGIADCLGVEVVKGTIGRYKTVGVSAVVTNCGILSKTSVTDEELASLEKLFKVKGAVGTANMGVPFIGLCMIANRNGFIAGELTSGFELNRIDEALGFMR
ncbi:translation initiation factor IF-6 [Candidatus Micrarchaeota archaeon]|nr:translation initiation factor IF-6 [Candidatus Micrarchaeota archaeon]